MDRGLKVRILLKESMKRHYELDEDLNSDLMTFLGFVYILRNIQKRDPELFSSSRFTKRKENR